MERLLGLASYEIWCLTALSERRLIPAAVKNQAQVSAPIIRPSALAALVAARRFAAPRSLVFLFFFKGLE